MTSEEAEAIRTACAELVRLLRNMSDGRRVERDTYVCGGSEALEHDCHLSAG